MENNKPRNMNSFVSIIVLFSYLFFGLIIVQLAVSFALSSLFDLSINDLSEITTHPTSHPEKWFFLMLFQGVSAIGIFIIVPLIYSYIYQISVKEMFVIDSTNFSFLAFVSFLAIVSLLPFVSFLGEINSYLEFPEFLAGFEQWAQQMEQQLAELTKFLLTFNSFIDFLIGFIVVAIIPAVGEELVFRGLIQNHFLNFFKNPHIAVVFTAVIFGVFHLQFYGVIPRVFLGIILGYLYLWSGNLWYPVIGHLVNNGLSVIMIYLFQLKIIDINVEEIKSVPIYSSIFSLFFGIILMYLFRKKALS